MTNFVVTFFVLDDGLRLLLYWKNPERRVDIFYLRGKILN